MELRCSSSEARTPLGEWVAKGYRYGDALCQNLRWPCEVSPFFHFVSDMFLIFHIHVDIQVLVCMQGPDTSLREVSGCITYSCVRSIRMLRQARGVIVMTNYILTVTLSLRRVNSVVVLILFFHLLSVPGSVNSIVGVHTRELRQTPQRPPFHERVASCPCIRRSFADIPMQWPLRSCRLTRMLRDSR